MVEVSPPNVGTSNPVNKTSTSKNQIPIKEEKSTPNRNVSMATAASPALKPPGVSNSPQSFTYSPGNLTYSYISISYKSSNMILYIFFIYFYFFIFSGRTAKGFKKITPPSPVVSPLESTRSDDSSTVLTPSPRASPIPQRIVRKLTKPLLQETTFLATPSPSTIQVAPRSSYNIDMQLKELYVSLAEPNQEPQRKKTPTPRKSLLADPPKPVPSQKPRISIPPATPNNSPAPVTPVQGRSKVAVGPRHSTPRV